MQLDFRKALLKKDMLVLARRMPSADKALATVGDIAYVLESFASLGYTLDNDAIAKLYTITKSRLATFYVGSFALLEEARGTNVEHQVFYPDFPNIQGLSPEEQYLRAVLHYITAREDDYGFVNQDLPSHIAVEVSNDKKQVLRVVDEDEAEKILIDAAKIALEQNLPIPHSEQSLYSALWKEYARYISPGEIPFKENMALYLNSVVRRENGKPFIEYHQLSFCRTMTDILRVYACLCKSAELCDVKFESLPRSSRRAMLKKINELAKSPNAAEDMHRHEFLWKRASELLHPYDFRNKYPAAFELITAFRNDNLPQSYYSKLEECINEPRKYIALLTLRPTEFARKLDYLLRSYDSKELVLAVFERFAGKASVNALVSLWKHFANRDSLSETRDFMFYANGGMKLFSVPENRAPLSGEICDRVIEIVKNTLSNRFKDYPQKGKLYIAPDMEDYTIPVSGRMASAQAHTLNYGTSLKLDCEDNKFIRIFTHWHNAREDRVDIDLSVELYSDSLVQVDSISWHNINGGHYYKCYHSGDLTTAPNGASEFIDFDYEEAATLARYAVVCNYNYTGQPFSEVPECFSGFMFMPRKAKKGAVFNAQFVESKFDLVQQANKNIAFVLDLWDKRLIWADINPVENTVGLVASLDGAMQITLRKLLSKQISIDEWMRLHLSHLELTDNRDEADYIVDKTADASVSVYDAKTFSAEWM